MTGASGARLTFIRQISGFAGLVLVAGLGWSFLFVGEQAMGTRGGGFVSGLMHQMMRPTEVGAYLAAASFMWLVMMLAMMIPAALLMMWMFRRMDRGDSVQLDTTLVGLGYLAAWSAFAVVAAALQWWLHSRGWLGGMSLSLGAGFTSSLLILAGSYQLTPWKDACLARCRTPLGFFLEHWRDGRLGALSMGWRHGLFCMGCCWLLMLLMFAGGAMSVVTMAALCIFILAERLLPAGPWVSRLPGLALIVLGVWFAVDAGGSQ